MSIQDKMRKELQSKKIFDQARKYAFEYSDQVGDMRVYPSEADIQRMESFSEKMPEQSSEALAVLKQLQELGSKGTIAQTGGRYFGFVNGGAVPAALAAKWLADFWDQNGGLYLTSPINAKLESVCESWLKELFGLPEETLAGFVSGTSLANLCGLAAARTRLLKNQGWDVNAKGLNGAPPIRIVAHRQVHSAIKKSIALLGFGIDNVEWIAADEDGCMILSELPELDNRTMVLIQAGNVNTGAYDDFTAICEKANAAGAWVHIDGAFGLWAAATKTLSHLTKGIELANSWAVDGHKTLNTPYDCGIVLCRDSEALLTAMQATGAYIQYSEQRDPLLFIPEMSKRSRAIELWATLKYLGKNGIDEMIVGFHQHALNLATGLEAKGFRIINNIEFNQVLVACENDALTKATLLNIQNSGDCWCGGTTWLNEAAIRVSICSWATTDSDIEKTIATFSLAKNQAMANLKT